MKRFLAILLSLILCFTAMNPVNIFATDAQETEYTLPTGGIRPPKLTADTQILIPDRMAAATDNIAVSEMTQSDVMIELDQRLKEALLAGKETIDISDMHLGVDQYPSIMYMSDYSPYLTCDITCNVFYNPAVNAYSNIRLYNALTQAETVAHVQQVEHTISEVIASVPAYATDVEKALYIHDYIVSNFEYYSTDSYFPSEAFIFGEMLQNGRGVCQAYALGYMYLMSLLGIPCYYTASEEMNHGWNIIAIGGEYYHVDCTWDDPVPDFTGLSRHDYFLLGDDTIEYERPTSHHDWDLQGVLLCNDAQYEDDYWIYADSPVVQYNNDVVYYISNDMNAYYKFNLIERNRTTGEETSVCAIGYWPVYNQPGYFYTSVYSGLFENGGSIFFNDYDTIFAYSPAEDTVHEVMQLPTPEDGYFYGIRRQEQDIVSLQQFSYYEGNAVTAVWKGYLNTETNGFLLNQQSVTVAPGGSATLVLGFLPYGMYENITWTSSNPNVAIASTKEPYLTATVKGLRPGTAVITGTTASGASASCTVTVTEKKFDDVFKTDWYYETVQEVFSTGIMTGATDTSFRPKVPMSRGMMAAVLYRMAGSPAVNLANNKFPDVGKNDWYASSVIWAASAGVINGYNSGRFAPNDNVTREQVATMLCNYAKFAGKYTKAATTVLDKFNDEQKISSYAVESMQWAVANGLISGKDNGTRLDPQGTATRAECAKMLLQAYKILKANQ